MQKAACKIATSGFQLREWEPREAGLPDVPAGRQLSKEPSRISFVSENKRVESRYEVLSPNSAPELNAGSTPAVTCSPAITSTPGSQAAVPAHLPITDPTEGFFMERYCTIIGPWFDMFDSKGHWSHIVPHLALSNRSLFRSIVASCAKQYSLVARESSIFALDYYNHALKELTQALDDPEVTGSAAVFASCLLTGYCEMIDSRSLDWQTHLRGTFSLCSTQGWHGLSGGVAQSCFWVYCRMDLLASLARAEKTSLDPGLWLPDGGSLAPSTQEQSWDSDSWSNQVVLLLAHTHNLLCDVRKSSYGTADRLRLLETWTAVSKALHRHEASRPATFHPVVHLPPSSATAPFERIVYVSATASAATQMLHLAFFLLIVAYPDQSAMERQVRLTSYTVTQQALTLSQRIIGNSIANRLTIAWANAVQLLFTAGLILVAENERAALVEVLKDIGSATGWSVHGHIESLNEWWTSSDDRGGREVPPLERRLDGPWMLRQVGDSLVSLSADILA
ncbi:hypothetical protein LTR47_010102 [Exophiala xenobiotica]|nr:hypothetical protein LTR47_010102 [Exophiala xenobiotica]KAK5226745.1 hypothetical protein LTR72_002734 [Exophiala xenobiotica]KAK5244944.1 hypothetical protein LTS06_009537 [Exophiala xenobiotica]KAK5300492.1 hypothetical protein LTR14_000889 [Exophiala xenobiotica]KAK5331066.1 hypothetical protein LTR93_000068 [Exophiala xenobiotica]